ncbi:MAG: response regulator, partial [Actinobacteria bacterium]
MRRALRSVLDAAGYDVEAAPSGEDALRCAAERTPEAVVLDLAMPGMDGFETCRRLREWFHGPVMVLSVRDSDEDKIRALDLGADDYLTKPFS